MLWISYWDRTLNLMRSPRPQAGLGRVPPPHAKPEEERTRVDDAWKPRAQPLSVHDSSTDLVDLDEKDIVLINPPAHSESHTAPTVQERGRAQQRSENVGELIITAGNDAGRRIPLDGTALVVGRGTDSNVVLTDIAVSRHHCELRFSNDQCFVHDLGSGNGTLINGALNDAPVALKTGDQIEIGNTTLTLSLGMTPVAGLGWDEQPTKRAGRPKVQKLPQTASRELPVAPLEPLYSQASAPAVPRRSGLKRQRSPMGSQVLPVRAASDAAILQAEGSKPSKRKKFMLTLFGIATLGVVALAFTRAGSDPDGTARVASARPAQAPLPVSTWGTEEPSLIANVRNLNRPKSAAAEATPPAPPEQNQEDATRTPPAENLRRKTDDQETDSTKTDSTKTDSPKTDSPKTDSPKTDKAKRSRTAKPARDNNKAPQVATGVTAAKVAAKASYAARNYAAAAARLRKAARTAPARIANALRKTARTYETVGKSISRGQASHGSNAVAAFQSYRAAQSQDRRVGSVHAAYLQRQLASVAPKAAALYLARGKYSSAKLATTFARSHPTSQRVRESLERKAGQLYARANRLKQSDPAQAKKLIAQIRGMVVRSSSWYEKATRLLANL